jgi:hypothetical protein
MFHNNIIKVTGEGRKRNQISVGSCSEVTFPGKISDADLRSLNASIQVSISPQIYFKYKH